MRNVSWLMFALRLLELHQEALEFWCESVGVINRRRQQIHQRPRVLAFILLDSAIALMDGYADLVDLFSVNHHRLDAFRDHRLRDLLPADARHFYFLTSGDAHFVGHRRAYLHEPLRNQL